MLSKKVNLPAVLALFIGLIFTTTFVNAQTTEEQGQSAVLSGTVIDAETEQPIAGIKVKIKGTEESSETDQEGMFSFTELQPGTYTVLIEVDGYKTFTKEVNTEEQVESLEIKLQPAETSSL